MKTIDYHGKYVDTELTKHCSVDGIQELAGSDATAAGTRATVESRAGELEKGARPVYLWEIGDICGLINSGATGAS